MSRVSCEKICVDHKNINATTMAMDDNLSIVALSGKQAINLIRLDKPNEIIHTVSRQSKWDTIASDFHPKNKLLYALTSNNNVELYSFEQNNSKYSSFHSYNSYSIKNQTNHLDEVDNKNNTNVNLISRAHTRTITDLNWCPFSYNLLATSSIDTFVHIWDIRSTKNSKLSLSSIAGVNQVKWNKVDENLIATSHEVDIRIWDIRKGNSPVHYIAAHLQKIYGLDWHPSVSTQLATCSQDNTVKFWDLNFLKNKAESIITNTLPIWKSKYTPIGNSLVTVIVSNVKQTPDNSLWLWNTSNLEKPAYSFVGPQDFVIDFHFRTNRSTNNNDIFYKNLFTPQNQLFKNEQDNLDNEDNFGIMNNKNKLPNFELVSWSKDNKLRIWELNENVLKVIDLDENHLNNLNNNHLSSNSYKKKLINEDDYFKNITNETKINENEQGIVINFKPNLLNKLKENYNSSSSDLKDLVSKNQVSKKTRKSSMAISPTYISPTDLKQEFNLIDTSNLKNLKIEEMNAMKRYCVIQAKSIINSFVYRLKIAFPISYPNNIPPSFFFLDNNSKNFENSLCLNEKTLKSKSDEKLNTRNDSKNTSFDLSKLSLKDYKLYQETKSILLKTLQNTAHMQVKRNRPCLEPCLKDFMARLDKPPNNINYSLNDTLYGSFHDGNIPFPKTCGAKFCGPNLLVCFSRPNKFVNNENKINNTPTPKALSALSNYFNLNKKNNLNVGSSLNSLNRQSDNIPNIFPISVSSFYMSNRNNNSGKVRHKSAKNKHLRNPNWKCLPVCVYDMEKILPCSKYLAENYIFDSDPIAMCTYNANIAAKVSKKDHFNTWTICKLVSDPLLRKNRNDCSLMDCPWAKHPFGRKLIDSFIDYYLSILDIQMVVMLTCCFSSYCFLCKRFACSGKECLVFTQSNEDKKTKVNIQPIKNSTNNSPYHTIGASATIDQNNKNIFDRNSIFNTSKDLQTQLNSYDIIRRHRSNSWSDLVETNGSLSDLTVIDSTCSITGSVNSPSYFKNNNLNFSNSFVVNLDQCMSCNLSPKEEKLKEKNSECMKCTNDNLDRSDNDLRYSYQEKQFKYDCLKQVYGDLLFRWKLFEQKSNMMNYVKISNNYQQFSQYLISYSNSCLTCNEKIKNSLQCKKCKKAALECSVCHLSVKGLINLCFFCGHGGHSKHINDWFIENDLCPTGCGCNCKLQNLEELFNV